MQRRQEPLGRGRPPPRGPAGHPSQDGDRLLAGPAPPQGPSGPWSAQPDQRSYPQGSQADRCRQEEGAQVMAKPKPGGRRPRKRERRKIGRATSELQSLMRRWYARLCMKTKKKHKRLKESARQLRDQE